MNREEIATRAMAALMSRQEKLGEPDEIAGLAIDYTDALVKRLQQKPDPQLRRKIGQ